MKALLLAIWFVAVLPMGKAQVIATEKKTVAAVRTDESLKIDGHLDEASWQLASPATDFTQFQFQWNVPTAFRSEVKVMYDNNALYIGAMLYDPAPDSIRQQLSQRDQLGATDFFGFAIDTYRDGINGFEFIVSAGGVQLEAKLIDGGNEDFNWDAVWQSAAAIHDNGWVAEIKIPYSAIRFPNKEEQDWGIQFFREVNRNRDKSSWNRLEPEIDGFLNMAGILTGLKGIEAPVRLSLTPYVSAYYDVFNNKPESQVNTSTSWNGGADLKYGLNDAFTLDMTLIPDFGQVQSDNQVLNLTPFEVFFVERRQFFTEGVELFNRDGLFYSRRIGGTPINFFNVYDGLDSTETVVNNPQTAQLLNASKVSGRTQSGLGIGIFNAVEGNTYATIEAAEGGMREELTGPATNYNVVVFDQNLKNNSNAYVINTNVLRSGVFRDANVTGGGLNIKNAEQTWGISGRATATQRFEDGANGPEMGYAHNMRAGKIGGNFQATAGYWLEGPTYNPNDLGFLQTNNTVNYSTQFRYNIFDPFCNFNSFYTNCGVNYTRLVEPDEFFNFSVWGEVFGGFKDFTFAGIFFGAEPVVTYDWFEPRMAGRYYTFPVNFNSGFFVSTDYSKRFAIDINSNFRVFGEEVERDIDGKRNRLNMSVEPRIRVSDKLFITVSQSVSIWPNDIGWTDPSIGWEEVPEDFVLLGRRDVREYSSILNIAYTPTVKMNFSFRLRHYWSYADYQEFFELGTDGLLNPTDYDTFDGMGGSANDANFNAFNIDLVYTWLFAPGSQLNIVWKEAIYQFGDAIYPEYFRNMEEVFASPIGNNFSIKVIYFLDYLYLQKR